MSVLNLRLVFVLVLAIGCGGCASKKALPYAFSAVKASPAGAPVLKVDSLKDERAAREDLNEVLVLPQAVEDVLVKELERSGLFSRVETNSAVATADFVLGGELNRFEWEVPEYGRIVGTAAGVSLATGGIGGVIYGSTKTDVLGHATLRFVVTGKDGGVVLDKRYNGEAKERMTKFKCDLPKARRLMVARALREAMEEFKRDLERVVKGGGAVVVKAE